jgi:hypothetical protein
MEKHQIKVGQKLYQETNGGIQVSYKEVEVLSVGNKYFYLKDDSRKRPYCLEKLRYEQKNYSQANIQLYLDPQEILDLKERSYLMSKFSKHFNWINGDIQKNTLEQLRKAAEALGIENGYQTLNKD